MNKTVEVLKDIVAGTVKSVSLLIKNQKSLGEIEKSLKSIEAEKQSIEIEKEQLKRLDEILSKDNSVVTVKNPVDKVDIKSPVKLDKESTSNINAGIMVAFKAVSEAITKAGQSLKIKWPSGPREAIPVRLTDGESFYNSRGGGVSANSSQEKIKVVDDNLNVIDFATSDRQLPDNHNVTVSNPTADPETGLAKEVTLTNGDQKTQLVDENGDPLSITDGKLDVNSAPAVGGATSVNQESQITLETTLNSLVGTLQELIQRLEPLAGAVANTAQIRVIQTTVPSTAVTGPITSAQSIAEKAVAGISYPEKMATTNLTAVISNINNVG